MSDVDSQESERASQSELCHSASDSVCIRYCQGYQATGGTLPITTIQLVTPNLGHVNIDMGQQCVPFPTDLTVVSALLSSLQTMWLKLLFKALRN